jgi:hypothetical protein
MKVLPSLATGLTILFVALKLTKTITWAWLWVVSPLWIYFGALALLAITFIALDLLIKRGERKAFERLSPEQQAIYRLREYSNALNKRK